MGGLHVSYPAAGHLRYAYRAPGQAWSGLRFIAVPEEQAEQLRYWIEAPGGQFE